MIATYARLIFLYHWGFDVHDMRAGQVFLAFMSIDFLGLVKTNTTQLQVKGEQFLHICYVVANACDNVVFSLQ